QHEKALQFFERSLQLNPDDAITLSCYAGTLAEIGRHEKALEFFERSLQLNPDDAITLNRYANTLVSNDQHEKALQFFERSLQLNPDDAITLSCYAGTLAEIGRHEKALEFLERSLQIDPDNAITFSRYYANTLVSNDQHEKALQFFERSLQLQPDDAITLFQCAKALVKIEQYEKALILFEKSLLVKPDDVITLNHYSNLLVRLNRYNEALRVLERSLKIEPNDVITLCIYATTLALLGRYEEAFKYFDHALQIKPNDIKTLLNYSRALVSGKEYRKSLKIYEYLATLEPNDPYIIGQYGVILNKWGFYKKACDIFECCVQLRDDNFIFFQYARALEELGQYYEAIHQLQKIDLSELTSYQANVIRLSLGRLHYRTHNPVQGEEYFTEAIKHSDDKERTLLYSARSILASNPFSETAIEKLKQIEGDSPRYAQAMEMLTLNLSGEDYFDMVKTDAPGGLSDTEMLNRAMYHKIANEISILKGIAYRILRRADHNQPLLQGIIDDIEAVFEEVDRRRAAQKSEIEAITQDHYGSILAVIAKTAHDISDFVNNQLAIIESKTRRAMRKLEPDSSTYPQFEKLLNQLELTQTALSDLKAINEGIQIKRHRFQVKSLFEKWEANPYIGNAQIYLNIQNGGSEINSDAEKIKSALNELVENSLKHNAHQSNLVIQISSRDVINPEGIWGQTIPGEQQYLYIEYTDNGKGIPDDKKDWIFQPLKTTSEEGKGSGLGLFIIRKTLIKMDGYIKETGLNGVRFELYIPYKQADGE
ncbi:MAG: tetratricopeptide repeat protein, partial [Leptolyngbyaceae bacterium]|nr:tetratricopeptide repeat protein [Leptolyngbyaceae bacterium]